MTTPAYPALLCDPDVDTWKEGIVDDPTLRSKKMVGILVTRPQFTRVPKTWQYRILQLTDSDKQLLKQFEAETVRFGALSFYWQNFQEAYGCDARMPGIAVVAGQVVQPLIPNGRSYKCTTGGTTHISATPAWPTTVGGAVTDGTVVWKENTYRVRFAAPIEYEIGIRIDYWQVNISLVEV